MYLAAVAGGHLHGGNKHEVGFCSYCGRLGGDGRQRVCADCGLGVWLHTDDRALRSPAMPFLIVRADGTVSAASAAAERELGGAGELVGAPVRALLHSPAGSGVLERAITRAAHGEGGVVTLPVVRVGGRRFRGDLRATVAPCGDPAAALVAIERHSPSG